MSVVIQEDTKCAGCGDLADLQRDNEFLCETCNELADAASIGLGQPAEPGAEPYRRPPNPDANAPLATKRSARDDLVDLVEEHYTIGRTEDERTFLVDNEGPNLALFSGPAKQSLARRYLSTAGKTVGRTPIDEAWLTIEGLASDVPKIALDLRVASHNGKAIIDIGDVAGRAIEISARGWQILERSPVTFRRSRAMLAIPDPETGGSVDELFTLLPVAPASRDLFAAWLALSFFSDFPHPAPVFRGEQGASKSTTTRAVSKLLDPCMADTQKPPKADDDWSHVCGARWVVAVDNVSVVPEWWSDALCRTITGDGWLRRELYTDDDVVVTKWRRCVILNGISLGASLRPDLAERLVLFELQRPAQFLTEAEVDDQLDDMRPRVLGALLDRAVATLAAGRTTEPVRDLRMADFATHLAAHDAGNGTKSLDGYRNCLAEAFDEAMASDPIATAVIELMIGRDSWEGTATELLDDLEAHKPKSDGEYWPKSSSALSSAMTRSAPNLRRIGLSWSPPRRSGKGGRRVAKIARSAESPGSTGDASDGILPPRAPLSEGVKGDAGDAVPPLVASTSLGSESGEEGTRGSTTRGESVSPASPPSPDHPEADKGLF